MTADAGSAMPEYFFHTIHGEVWRDRDGETFAGPTEARRNVLRVMGEILRDAGEDFLDEDEFSVLCTDERGGVVMAVSARRHARGATDALTARMTDQEVR